MAQDERGGAATRVHEYESSPHEVGVGYISGKTFTDREVVFSIVDGEAVFEGCIILGKVEDLQRTGPHDAADTEVHAVVISGDEFRWQDGIVPFEIDDDLPDQDRVRDAIDHWERNTRLRFVERTAANRDDFPDYVRFVESDDRCSSSVGRRGGEQVVRLAAGCTMEITIHEIGHAVGQWHEQSREDRDDFVTVNWENIQAGRAHNFNQHITDGDDVGPYDYNSIMHYGRTAFSRNGRDTITPDDPDAEIGQRIGLSPGDCLGVRWMYRDLEPTFPDVYSGVQFRASLAPRATGRWFTHSWPAHWFVVWSVVPTAPVRDRAAQLGLTHQVERQSGGLLKHYLEVQNLTGERVSFEARFDILGWSLAFT